MCIVDTMDKLEVRDQLFFFVSKTRLLLIHLLTYDTSFYIKEGLENLMSLEFFSYQAFLG